MRKMLTIVAAIVATIPMFAQPLDFSKTLRLLKHLIENPELLELKASEEVEY